MISPGYTNADFYNRNLVAAVGFALVMLTGCTPYTPNPEARNGEAAEAAAPAPKKLPRGTVLAADYPDAWPWPDFASGRLSCRNGSFGGVRRPLVLIELGNTKYGLNGAAIGVGEYPDARTLMGRDEFGAYAGDSGVFIDMGLELCKRV